MRLGLGISIPGTSGLVQAAFSPLDLSPVLWLDASDTSTITESGGAVSQWDDKSGNGNHVTQGTAALQPKSGTRTANSLNVIDFIPNDYLVSGSFSVSQPFSIVAVALFDSSTATPSFLLHSPSPATNAQIRSGSAEMYAGTGLNGSIPLSTATPYIFRWTGNSTSSSIHVDGVLDVSGNAGTNGIGNFLLGNQTATGRQWDGAIAEVIVVDGTLTAGQIADVETYLANKWGITI